MLKLKVLVNLPKILKFFAQSITMNLRFGRPICGFTESETLEAQANIFSTLGFESKQRLIDRYDRFEFFLESKGLSHESRMRVMQQGKVVIYYISSLESARFTAGYVRSEGDTPLTHLERRIFWNGDDCFDLRVFILFTMNFQT